MQCRASRATGVLGAVILLFTGAQPPAHGTTAWRASSHRAETAGRVDRPDRRPPADSGTISGVVRDAISGAPLPAVVVRIDELHRGELTHEGGGFALGNLPEGTYTVSFRRLGYAPEARVVSLGPGERHRLDVSMRPSAVQLSPVVITGTVEGRRQEETVRPTNVVSAQELDRQLDATLAGTLRNEPGIAVASMGPATARPVIRGLTGDRILILEDGSRSGDLSSASRDHAVAIDPLTAEQLEVVRGPAALLYGSNALGGVVNVIREEIPRSRLDQPHGVISVQGQSVNDARTAAGSVAGSVRSLALRAEGIYRRSGDLDTPLGPVANTALESASASVGAGWVRPWGHLGAAYRFYDSFYGIPPEPEGHPEGVNVDMRRHMLRGEAELHAAWGPFSSLRADGALSRYHHRELEPGGIVGTEFGLLTAQGNLLARHGRLGRLVEGAVGTRVQARDYAAGGSQGNPPTQDWAIGGFFLEEFGDERFRFQIGGRYDWHRVVPLEQGSRSIGEVRTRTFGALSGSVGAVYLIGGGVRVGGSLARAFRAPDITELFSLGPHLAAYRDERGNPDLEEETGLGIDAFVRLTGGAVRAEVAVFRNAIDNYIYPRNTGTPSPRNPSLDLYVYSGGDAVLAGYEAQLEWSVLPSWVLDGAVSYVQGTLRTEQEPLPLIPPLHGHVGIRYERPSVFAGVTWRAASAQDRVAPFEEPTARYSVMDLSAGYRWFALGQFHTLTLGVDNLFDVVYREHLSEIKRLMPAPGRNISLLYRLTFDLR